MQNNPDQNPPQEPERHKLPETPQPPSNPPPEPSPVYLVSPQPPPACPPPPLKTKLLIPLVIVMILIAGVFTFILIKSNFFTEPEIPPVELPGP